MNTDKSIVAQSSRNYYVQIILLTFVLFGVSCFAFFVGRIHNATEIILCFLFLEFIVILHKFTNKIEITNGKLRITYFKWLLQWHKQFDAGDVSIERNEMLGNRGYRYTDINILDKGKKVYSIEMGGTYSGLDDFYLIESYFNAKKKGSVEVS